MEKGLLKGEKVGRRTRQEALGRREAKRVGGRQGMGRELDSR